MNSFAQEKTSEHNNISPCTKNTTINKWDLMKLKGFCKAKATIKKTKFHLQNGKRFSPTPHMTEG